MVVTKIGNLTAHLPNPHDIGKPYLNNNRYAREEVVDYYYYLLQPGHKRKILTDVERALRRVQKYTASTKPSEVGYIEPKLKKRKKSWLLQALSEENYNEGETNVNLSTTSTHKLQKQLDCIYCHAMRLEYEPPTFCCASGYIQLAPDEVGEDLYKLFTDESKEAILFRKHIRAYNSIFAFTSFGVQLNKELASSRKGIYSFKAQGQIYHDLPSLIPKNDRPRYFQLYFYDTDHEVANRMSILQDANLSEEVMKKIRKIMEQNPYAKFFTQLKHHSNFQNLEIRIAANASLDQRVYNKPSVDQVAAIWVDGNNPNISFERDIVVHEHSGNKHQVKHYYGCYDPLQYPLILPNGEGGWHQGIVKSHNPNITIPTYTTTAANICPRSYASATEVLNNEEQVDMYIKLETTRLEYYRFEQSNYRREILQGIVDSVTAGEYRGEKVGQRVLLPGSFIGGPRDMRRRYMDAMALVQEYGRPDLFITMTCNPEWTEIQEQLCAGQVAQDRPDLVTRVFRAKLQDLKDQIFKKEIFGPTAAHVFVVEFQKRGLPHIHILLILKQGHKITSADQYDRYISAELPAKDKQPELHELVIKHMIHGPCGIKRQSSPCMKDGQCKFHYPRAFNNKTIQRRDGYPIYRRKNDGRTSEVRGMKMNNQWVVPYNPYLLKRYNCHINVEVCSGVKAIKYLYKYIYKGHDKCAVYIESDEGEKFIDEIRSFQDARWVSPPEAMWRIYEFTLSEMQPAVINLQLHLPGKQAVYYWKKQNLQNIAGSQFVQQTMLTEYFRMCLNDTDARNYLYREFPKHYVWNSQSKVWTKRKSRSVIGRINVGKYYTLICGIYELNNKLTRMIEITANPREGERYYERLLLNHVRGPTSFEDLLTVNGIHCHTFKEAAKERGLLESDDSISECLREAVIFKMPVALRMLFATILVHCNPTDVRRLWDTYYNDMSDDFQRTHAKSAEAKLQSTLKSVNSYLESMGQSVAKFDMPQIQQELHQGDTYECREIVEERSVKVPTEDMEAQSKLNEQQTQAFKTILQRTDSGTPGLFFVDGPGGTGKTYLYRALLAHIRSRGMIALASASSGVAAAILPGGRTAHSRFGIPLQANESTMTNMSKQSGGAKLIKQAKLIIWDEAPMAKRHAIETVDRSFRDIMEKNVPFGGKVMVFGGGFRQVLPVVPKSTRAETVDASLVRSYLWPLMEKIHLTSNMRARTDPNFSNFLIRVGNGEENTIRDNLILLPQQIVVHPTGQGKAEECLVTEIFKGLQQNYRSAKFITERAILASRNEFVDNINEMMITRFPGETRTYISFDSAEDDTNNYYQEEYLNTLTPNGLPPHRLVLKENAPIMMLRNLDPSNGLCNGTRLICRGFDNNVVHAEITTGEFATKHVFIPRIQLSPPENEGYPFKFIRKQFPIRLCFAMTINKAQGQTIPNVGLYLPQHVFSHGQLYVALSRGISMATTNVLVMTEQPDTGTGTYARNIVYKEVLG
ncbi:uncharacterized protein LOC125815062 [Solanum verrucosum]|uniref:uncharacterized protein LOC125815062 n=1 Tax=Solanum verrucosum TaxID=315347 RepID=UPI0020D1295B|nr:uncharacterized protein LOC125815062 [Solanum verrucosum]